MSWNILTDSDRKRGATRQDFFDRNSYPSPLHLLLLYLTNGYHTKTGKVKRGKKACAYAQKSVEGWRRQIRRGIKWGRLRVNVSPSLSFLFFSPFFLFWLENAVPPLYLCPAGIFRKNLVTHDVRAQENLSSFPLYFVPSLITAFGHWRHFTTPVARREKKTRLFRARDRSGRMSHSVRKFLQYISIFRKSKPLTHSLVRSSSQLSLRKIHTRHEKSLLNPRRLN